MCWHVVSVSIASCKLAAQTTEYGCTVLTGPREMAVGNTFGATALSSYGGFWISIGITFTPGGFNIMGTYEKAGGGSPAMFYDSLGIFLMVPIPRPQSPVAISPSTRMPDD